jgi:hypothetical protein
MSTGSFTPKAEFLWFSIPEPQREMLLRNVWCGHCRTAVEIVDYTGREVRGDVLLEGRCKVCGGGVGRHVETARRKSHPD